MKLKEFKIKNSFILNKYLRKFRNYNEEIDSRCAFIGFNLIYWFVFGAVGLFVCYNLNNENGYSISIKLYLYRILLLNLIIYLFWKICFNLRKGGYKKIYEGSYNDDW